MALDDANVFITDRPEGSVLRVPKAGGDPVVIAAKQDRPNGITQDAKYLYWTDHGIPGIEGLGSVMKLPK